LLAELVKIHTELNLGGQPKNALLLIKPELLNYLISILSDKPIIPPTCELEEWNKLIKQLGNHGISPLFYWEIKQLAENFQPPTAIKELLHQAFKNSLINVLRTEATIKLVIPALKKANIPCLVLKGPNLAFSLYPHPATRPSCDLDILTRPEYVLAARKVLEELDYHCRANNFEISQGLNIEDVFSHPKLTSIELHWDLLAYQGLLSEWPLDELFANTKGNELSLTNNFIHLAAHALILHNQELSLKWIYDLSLLTKEVSRLNLWPEIIEQSSKLKANLCLDKALQLTKLWTGVTIPETITWPKISRVEERAWQHNLKRHTNLLSWFMVRFPRNISWREKIKLLCFLLGEKRNKLRRYIKIPFDKPKRLT